MSNKGKGGYKPQSEAAFPTKFRCKVGGEWKPLSMFSTNQQKFLNRQRESGLGINAAHSGMTCIDHAKKNTVEYRCERCNLIKPANEYSKSSRKNEVYQCKRCVAWAETQEADVTPTALEYGHHISAEEMEGFGPGFSNSGDFFSAEALPQAPVTALESLGLQEFEGRHTLREILPTGVGSMTSASELNSETSVTSGTTRDDMSVSGASVRSQLPPHLASIVASRATVSVKSSVPSLKGKEVDRDPAPMGTLPPHLLKLRSKGTAGSAPSQKENVPSTSSVASGSEIGSSANGESRDNGVRLTSQPGYAASISTATTVRQEREQKAKGQHVSFNAWDPRGQQHSAVKSPTVVSSSTSAVSTGEPEGDNQSEIYAASSSSLVHGEWPTITMPEPESRSRGSKWPKSSESRIPQNQLDKQPKLPHISTRHINPDIDRQRRMKYCDSDDSDY